METVMEVIDDHNIKPILKHSTSQNEQYYGFLGELKVSNGLPPIIKTKKQVVIMEENNDIGLTYSQYEYDRKTPAPSLGTQFLINTQNALKAEKENQKWTELENQYTCNSNASNDLVLTEHALYVNKLCTSWMGGIHNNSPNDFKVGEWADMFLCMDTM